MPERPDRWLVLAHQATNSGAPRVLLEVLRAVRAARGPQWQCEILLDRDGPLAGELATFGPLHCLTPAWAEGSGLVARVLRGLVDRPWLKPRRLRRLIGAWQQQGGGVIYSNTATNGRLLAALPSGVGPVITHVHELEYGLQRFNRPRDLATTLARTDRFIAVSTAVKTDLLARGVPADRVTIVPNFLSSLPAPAAVAAARSEVCRRLGLAAATRIVLGCGHVDPLKGTDLFVAMITQLTTQGTPVIGVWLGGDIDRHYARRVRQTAVSQVRFVGEVTDPELYYAASDLVTITSRVESFSRVALEAGALGRPVLAFAEARGPADLLPDVALVPEMTGAAMAAAAARLLKDEAAAGLLGQELRNRIATGYLAKHWTEHLLRMTAEVRHA